MRYPVFMAISTVKENDLVSLYRVGDKYWEVVWKERSINGERFLWREKFRKRCEAMSFYEDKLRTLAVVEATRAMET